MTDERPVQYCTHPAEREWTPSDSPVLPDAEICDHDECRPTDPVVELPAVTDV